MLTLHAFPPLRVLLAEAVLPERVWMGVTGGW